MVMSGQLLSIGVHCASSPGVDPGYAAAAQLGIHAKPCGVLDVNGFFAPLRALLDAAAQQRFISPEHRDMVIVESDSARMIDRLGTWTPVIVKWLGRSER
jgi:predicted Rossmann-fold nucleotide-binding protein